MQLGLGELCLVYDIGFEWEDRDMSHKKKNKTITNKKLALLDEWLDQNEIMDKDKPKKSYDPPPHQPFAHLKPEQFSRTDYRKTQKFLTGEDLACYRCRLHICPGARFFFWLFRLKPPLFLFPPGLLKLFL